VHSILVHPIGICTIPFLPLSESLCPDMLVNRTRPGMSWAGPFLPSKLPICVQGSGLSSNTSFLGSTPVRSPNCISIGSAGFAQLTGESLYFTTGRPPLKIAPSNGSIRTPSNPRFLGPSKSTTQTASHSVQPFLRGSRS